MIGSKNQSLQENDRFIRRAGGAPANVAVAASRLGADTSITATVGEDAFGDYLINKMESEGVNTENIKQVKENTTMAFVGLDEHSEPEFSFNRGADPLINQKIRQNHDILHIGSLPLTRRDTADKILEAIEESQATISFDPNLREELMTKEYLRTLQEVVEKTDILFATSEEIKKLDFEDILDKVDEVIETKGEQGAKIRTSDQVYSEKPPETGVVDTTGAGDALAGAYLRFRNNGVEKALDAAVSAAALSIKEKGAMSALPTIEELKNSQHNRNI